MAKQKRPRSTRSAYASATRFARSNRRTLGIIGASLAGAAAALFLGLRYRDQQAPWSRDGAAAAPAL